MATVADVEWITPFWPTESHPGYGCFVSDLWSALGDLSGRACRVHVSVPHPRPLAPAVRDLVAPLVGGPLWSLRARVVARLAAPLARRRIFELGTAPVHLHGGLGLEALLSVACDEPVFLHVHGMLGAKTMEVLSASRTTARRPLVVLPVSEHISTRLRLADLVDHVVVVPNGYNSRLFFSTSDKPRSGVVRILTVGNLAAHKNVGCVIEAVALLRRGGTPAVLRIVGLGPDRRSLGDLARRLGVEEHVSFLGARSQDCVARMMRSSDVFALPSRHEAFGVVFREAIASGLITIGGEGTGAGEAIGQHGHLVDPDSPVALADVIVKAIAGGGDSTRHGSPALDDWNSSARVLLDVYTRFGIDTETS